MTQPPYSTSFSSMMAPMMMLLVFILAMVGVSDGAWCICRSDVSSTSQQKTLDYACGAGADCNPITQNGPCYNPNTVIAHCSYAANSYYQRHGQAPQACDFSGTAQVSQTDPSPAGCTFPATPSAAGTSGTPSTTPTTPGSSTTTPTTPSTTTPVSPTTPNSPITGGGGGGGGGTNFTPNSPTTTTGGSTTGGFGLGPSGTGFDSSHANHLLPNANMGAMFLSFLVPGLLAIMRM